MNAEELDNRARIILKGLGLSRGKTAAIGISSIITLTSISPKGLRAEPARLVFDGRKDDSGSL